MTIEWVDSQQRTWRIDLLPQRVILRSGEAVIDLPADRWAKDLLITPHGQSFVIRVETFDLAVGFVVSAEQAKPLLAHVGVHQPATEPTREEVQANDPAPSGQLLWPRVSPLAVWALMASALVFIPILGWIAAGATVILLALHRKRVRRTPALSHSRVLCKVAMIFLIAGMAVSTLATWRITTRVAGLIEESGGRRPALNAPADPSEQPEPQRGFLGSSLLAKSLLDRDIDWGLLVSCLLVILVSLSVHETAHAITAWWLGDDFARRAGRVTLNPISHVDLFGTILLPFILFMAGGTVFGWAKPVPVRTDCLRNFRRDHILVSIAGPGSNLLLAAASLLLWVGLECVLAIVAPASYAPSAASAGLGATSVISAVRTILNLCFTINVFLAFFNLIPIPPLDGSWVLEHLFPNTLGSIYRRIRPYGFLLFRGLIYANMLPYLLYPATLVLIPGQILVLACQPL